jgi:hypothetical protein
MIDVKCANIQSVEYCIARGACGKAGTARHSTFRCSLTDLSQWLVWLGRIMHKNRRRYFERFELASSVSSDPVRLGKVNDRRV